MTKKFYLETFKKCAGSVHFTLLQSASTSGARWGDVATSDKNKQICLSTLLRTGFNTEVCSY